MSRLTPFPTIVRRGRRVRVAIDRQEPLYAVIEVVRGLEPEITRIVPRRLARALKRDIERCKVLDVGVRVKLVPIRWTLGDPTDPPRTLAEAFGVK